MGALRTVALVGMALTLVAAPGRAQDADRGAQKRPDGSLMGQLGGSALALGTYHALLIGINDGLELHGMDASVAALWVRASVVRNDADGRGYIFILVAPQKFQKDVLTEYQRILTSWKWTQR